MRSRARFTHSFLNVKGLDEDEAAQLVDVLRTGSKPEQAAARERLILGCGPMAVSLVARHVRQFERDKHRADDLISAAMVETTKAVERFSRSKSKHALSTLANAIRHAIRRAAQNDSGFGGLGADSRRRLKKRGVTIPTVKDVDPKDRPEPWARTTREADILEEVYASCADERDRQIVEMRLLDMSPRDIALALGMSPGSKSYISKRLREIWARYEARQ